MSEKKYHRLVQTAVTNFLYVGDEYLFLHRADNKRVDPGKLNGIGGRVEPGENFLDAAIRETEEETGYKVKPEDISLSAVVKLEGGYSEDWIMCFYKIKVDSKKIPHGNKTDDGKLEWIHKDEVLDSGHALVSDLAYLFKDIAEGNNVIFATAKLSEAEQVDSISISRL